MAQKRSQHAFALKAHRFGKLAMFICDIWLNYNVKREFGGKMRRNEMVWTVAMVDVPLSSVPPTPPWSVGMSKIFFHGELEFLYWARSKN